MLISKTCLSMLILFFPGVGFEIIGLFMLSSLQHLENHKSKNFVSIPLIAEELQKRYP